MHLTKRRGVHIYDEVFGPLVFDTGMRPTLNGTSSGIRRKISDALKRLKLTNS